eukprot:GCRY01000968.1.p1 GENE.GCRY01000968.1~~GCRY01000968.1.p1  ORF type:complete len:240 (+),score=19.57 GCRY01000968.1:297-1016(+)
MKITRFGFDEDGDDYVTINKNLDVDLVEKPRNNNSKLKVFERDDGALKTMNEIVGTVNREIERCESSRRVRNANQPETEKDEYVVYTNSALLHLMKALLRKDNTRQSTTENKQNVLQRRNDSVFDISKIDSTSPASKKISSAPPFLSPTTTKALSISSVVSQQANRRHNVRQKRTSMKLRDCQATKECFQTLSEEGHAVHSSTLRRESRRKAETKLTMNREEDRHSSELRLLAQFAVKQ